MPVHLRETTRLLAGPYSHAHALGAESCLGLGEDPFPIQIVTLLRMLAIAGVAEKRACPRCYESMEIARSLGHHFYRGYFLSFVEYYYTCIAPRVRSERA